MPGTPEAVATRWWPTPPTRLRSVFDASSYKEVARLMVGQGGSNFGFTPDRSTGFMSVTGANSVAVIDMAKFNVVSQIRAGMMPQGLIVL